MTSFWLGIVAILLVTWVAINEGKPRHVSRDQVSFDLFQSATAQDKKLPRYFSELQLHGAWSSVDSILPWSVLKLMCDV